MVWAQLSALCTEPAQESPEADWKQAGRGAGDFGAAVEVARRQGFGSAACAGVPACSRGAGSRQVGCDFRFSIPTSRDKAPPGLPRGEAVASWLLVLLFQGCFCGCFPGGTAEPQVWGWAFVPPRRFPPQLKAFFGLKRIEGRKKEAEKCIKMRDFILVM